MDDVCSFASPGAAASLNGQALALYSQLTPDLKRATFTGSETIVCLPRPSLSPTSRSMPLKSSSRASHTLKGKTLTAKVSTDAEKQQVTLHFDQPLPAVG